MSRLYTQEELGKPDNLTATTEMGDVINFGDEVVITRTWFDDDELDLQTITDESRAIFFGEYVITCEGEVLFEGVSMPLFEVDLDDGSKAHVWGFECNWSSKREFDLGSVALAEIVSEEIDNLNI